MTSKSKSKGASWERDCAKFLSDLYGENFLRNITGSGAYVGGKNVHRKSALTEGQIRSTKGDITPPDSWQRFNAEAKNYADLDFHNLYLGSRQLDTWLSQLLTVRDNNDFDILMFKITRKGKYVVVRPNDKLKFRSHTVYVSERFGEWRICDFEQFFLDNSGAVKNLCVVESV